MKKKKRNVIIYIIIFIVILASFQLPSILFKMQDNDFEVAIYEKEESKNNISIESQEVYLVKAIHDMGGQNNNVEIVSAYLKEKPSSDSEQRNIIEDIEKEIIKLKEKNIIKEFETNNQQRNTISIVKRFYKADSSTYYVINAISCDIGSYHYEMDIETKTKKILRISIDKDNLNKDISKEKLMRNYINYLELDTIDDWHFENDMMRSAKTELVVDLIEGESEYILALV